MLFFLWYSTPKALFIIYLANPLLMGYEFLCSCVEHSYGRTLTTTFAKKLVTLNYARKKKNVHLDIYTTGNCAQVRSSLWASAPKTWRTQAAETRRCRSAPRTETVVEMQRAASECWLCTSRWGPRQLDFYESGYAWSWKQATERTETNDSQNSQPCSSRVTLSKTFRLSSSFSPLTDNFCPSRSIYHVDHSPFSRTERNTHCSQCASLMVNGRKHRLLKFRPFLICLAFMRCSVSRHSVT